jgi:hypothetical protein
LLEGITAIRAKGHGFHRLLKTLALAALYQGTASAVPPMALSIQGFSP